MTNSSSESIYESPPYTLCKVCKSIFADNSWEWWDAYWKEIFPDDETRYWTPERTFADTKIHKSPDPYYPGRHHQSRESFQLAVYEGCWICKHIYKESPDSVPLSFALLQADTWRSGAREFELKFFQANPKFCLTPLALPLTEMSYLARCSRSRKYDGHQDVATLAAKWLSHCKANHKRCSISHGWKPSRLLDVSTNSIKLINGCEVPRDDEYATLSYCWGESGFMVLNKSTMDHFQEGVDVKKLPLTIKHAVLTVQRLKI